MRDIKRYKFMASKKREMNGTFHGIWDDSTSSCSQPTKLQPPKKCSVRPPPGTVKSNANLMLRDHGDRSNHGDHLVMTNTSPWKTTIFKFGKPSISIRAIYTMANC